MADNMDVDPPFCGKSSLKRSSSAPIINILPIITTNREETLTTNLFFDNQPRTRRFSASFSSGSLSPQIRIPSRVSQIKHEEGMDVVNREAAHEREVQSTIQIYQSCEDLTLTDCGEIAKKPRNFTEPLHIFPPATYPLPSSPSPTRVGKQCYSPSMQQHVRFTSFCTSPLPSPTRKPVARRSSSPISLRPSQLSVKRKCELEPESMDSYYNPPKRSMCSLPSSEKNLIVPHPLTHSLSSSSLEESSSPDQSVPVNVGTPESLSSVDSNYSSYKPMDQDSAPSTPTMMTISQETSL